MRSMLKRYRFNLSFCLASAMGILWVVALACLVMLVFLNY